MPPIFRKQSSIVCFYCISTVTPPPQNPRQFRCPYCNCWNRYNASGEILSDEPAMHDEALNKRSFAKRASAVNRLPTMYGKGPFCHNCQTNQMLLVNLLSNYLPPQESPEYEGRLATLPQYEESLHVRYPVVCDNCRPLVEDELRKRNDMARTKALGGWLKESKGKDRQRKISGVHRQTDKLALEMIAWRLRGGLWLCSLICAIAGNSAVSFGYPLPRHLSFLRPAVPPLVLLSLLWTAWDPTYHSYRKAMLQGRNLRIKGKSEYIKLQMLSWSSRFTTSILLAVPWFWPRLDYLRLSHSQESWRSRTYFSVSLLLEVLCLIFSMCVLQIQRPAPIRLIDTSIPLPPSTSRAATPAPERARSQTPAPTAPDFFSSLSLSSKPIVTSPPSNPIFGLPSLAPSAPSPPPPPNDKMDEDEERDAHAMDVDWSASGPPVKPQTTTKTDASDAWLRPQRFFAPERPTGLEGLFAKTKLADEPRAQGRGGRPGVSKVDAQRWNWGWIYVVSVLPLVGIAYKAWVWRCNELSRDL